MQVMQKALWRWAYGEAAGEETLEAVVADLHTGGLVLYSRFPEERSSMGNSAADLGDWADIFKDRTARTLACRRG